MSKLVSISNFSPLPWDLGEGARIWLLKRKSGDNFPDYGGKVVFRSRRRLYYGTVRYVLCMKW